MKRNSTLSVAIVLFGAGFVVAHEGHNDETGPATTATGPHSGRIHGVGNSYCEVVFHPKSVRVYLYDANGKPLSARRCRGTVSMKVDGNPKLYRFDLFPESTRGSAENTLFLAVDLSRVPDGAMTTSFSIAGVPGATQRSLAFSQPFRLTRLDQVATSPGHATRVDTTAIAQQKICPVMEEKLGSMGTPWKVHVEGRDVFVCCKGCIKFLQKEPQKYLSKLPNPPPAKATKADSAAIQRQRLCPVMDESLNSMGGSWKVYAKGRPIFVCCKGCIKKVQTNPNYYVAKTVKLTTTTGERPR